METIPFNPHQLEYLKQSVQATIYDLCRMEQETRVRQDLRTYNEILDTIKRMEPAATW